jgi:DNA-binding MarR family transcriptional regulator
MFKELDPILHSQLRLAIMSILISVKDAEFTFIKEQTNATAGNLSVQIQKLKEAGYIEVHKQFKDNYPQTICRVTPDGLSAFEKYVAAIQSYLHNTQPKTS